MQEIYPRFEMGDCIAEEFANCYYINYDINYDNDYNNYYGPKCCLQ